MTFHIKILNIDIVLPPMSSILLSLLPSGLAEGGREVVVKELLSLSVKHKRLGLKLAEISHLFYPPGPAAA